MRVGIVKTSHRMYNIRVDHNDTYCTSRPAASHLTARYVCTLRESANASLTLVSKENASRKRGWTSSMQGNGKQSALRASAGSGDT